MADQRRRQTVSWRVYLNEQLDFPCWGELASDFIVEKTVYISKLDRLGCGFLAYCAWQGFFHGQKDLLVTSLLKGPGGDFAAENIWRCCITDTILQCLMPENWTLIWLLTRMSIYFIAENTGTRFIVGGTRLWFHRWKDGTAFIVKNAGQYFSVKKTEQWFHCWKDGSVFHWYKDYQRNVLLPKQKLETRQ